MDVHLAILQLGKNNNQQTLNDAKTGIKEWRGSDPEPTQSELNEAWNTYKANSDAVAYKGKRKAEYPSVVDQLDDIYHNGIDGWKATIKKTKDKYPK